MTHGTRTAYGYWGCRCAQCRAANATHQRAYYQIRRASGVCCKCGEPATGLVRCQDCHDKMLRTDRHRGQRVRPIDHDATHQRNVTRDSGTDGRRASAVVADASPSLKVKVG